MHAITQLMEKKLSLESRIESLHEIEKIIDEISEKHQFAEELYGNILIAALEAVNNAITHGNKLDAVKPVRFELYIDNQRLKIITKDEGEGFDFKNIPDPTSPENIENITGRGIFLMKSLSDELNFYDDGRVSELIFNI